MLFDDVSFVLKKWIFLNQQLTHGDGLNMDVTNETNQQNPKGENGGRFSSFLFAKEE